MHRRASVIALFVGSAVVVVPTAAQAAVRCDGHVATIVGTAGKDRLTGTPGRDVIAGLGGPDTIRGLDGRDLICGGDGRDTIRGGGGADVVGGGPGGDFLLGGDGDDVLEAGPATRRGPVDSMSGDAGDDVLKAPDFFTVVSYERADGPVVVDLATGVAEAPGLGRDSLRGPRIVLGSRYDDDMVGSDKPDLFVGFGGEDTLEGGGGFDNLLGFGGADQLFGDGGSDFLDVNGLDEAHGGPGADTFFGTGRSTSFGEGGTDYFEPFIGGTPAFDGGGGEDALDFYGTDVPAEVDLAAGTASSDGAEATVTDIENVFGSNVDDVLSGDDGPNRLEGGRGDDTLSGRGDDDILDGRRGQDVLDGGDGTDACSQETVPRTSCETEISEIGRRLAVQARNLDRIFDGRLAGRPGVSQWLARWASMTS